jgi:ABC-2 type transport system ATP-binding protein
VTGSPVRSGDAPLEIVFEDVSKFYGEVLGVNRVTLTIRPGITSLVGPNGAGKSTLMSLMTGLLRPTNGRVRVLGRPPYDAELMRQVGYCTQHDSFPPGLTGRRFVESALALHGMPRSEARRRAGEALERVGLTGAADRRIGGYSKGMRQRVRLAHTIAHDPLITVLDEPLNGLDPMARAEVIALLRDKAASGGFVIVSSHILHEVDALSDRIVILDGGCVMADGEIHTVRGEIRAHPLQVLIRCNRPDLLAASVLAQDHVVEVKMHADRRGLLVATRDADRFYLLLNRVALEDGIGIESVTPADDDVHAVYRYLVGGDGEPS